jgi:aminoglycoside phosphotransferase family enzyme
MIICYIHTSIQLKNIRLINCIEFNTKWRDADRQLKSSKDKTNLRLNSIANRFN